MFIRIYRKVLFNTEELPEKYRKLFYVTVFSFSYSNVHYACILLNKTAPDAAFALP